MSDWHDSGTGPGYRTTAWERHNPKETPVQHQPWCTDHLSEDPSDPLTAGTDSCTATVDVIEPRDGRQGVHVTVSQDRDQAEPVVMVEVHQPLTVDEAERLYADLRGLLDAVKGLGS